MNENEIKNWIKDSGIYKAMPGAENFSIKRQVILVGAMAEMTNNSGLIEDCKKAMDILNG